MQFLRSWLQEYIDISSFKNSELADIISLRSGECEGYQEIEDWFGGLVVIGKITNLRKHPEADKLWIFEVDAGHHGLIPVVSGAPNVKEGLIVPVAMLGCKLPYLTIAGRILRGYESRGMCCGLDELMLATEPADGLWEVESEIEKIGQKVSEVLGHSVCLVLSHHFPAQTTFEIKYLHDQYSACASHLGMSLELAKILQRPELLKGVAKDLLDPQALLEQNQNLFNSLSASKTNSSTNLDFVDYTNQVEAFWLFKLKFEDNFYLPHKILQRLFLTEKNIVGSVADLSNYLLWDVGQPSHFFNYQKTIEMETKTWHIGFNDKVQNFEGLGQLKKTLVPIGLPIMTTDTGQIIHLPGVSGSNSSKVEAGDTEIFVEVANFGPEMVARSSFALNYRSDSSKFWSSGINQALMLVFLIQLVKLNLEVKIELVISFNNSVNISENKSISSNSDSSGFLTVAQIMLSKSITDRTLVPNIDYINKRLDGKPTEARKRQIIDLMANLGHFKQELDSQKLYANPFYGNWNTNEDLLFEITKLLGFDSLNTDQLTIQNSNLTTDSYKLDYKFRLWLASTCASFGLCQTISRPFLSKQFLIEPEKSLEAISSQRIDENFLRDSVLPSLLMVLNKNLQLGEKTPAIFEIAKVYTQENQTSGQNLVESEVLGMLMVAENPYCLTTLLNTITNSLNLKPLEIEPTQNLLTKWIGQGFIYNYATTQAKIIEVSKKLKKQHGLALNKKIWYLEFVLPSDVSKFNIFKTYTETSNYPTIKRSYSVEIGQFITWQEVLEVIENQIAQNIEGVKIQAEATERFCEANNLQLGEGLTEKETSLNEIRTENKDILNFNLSFTSYTRTLLGAEIDQFWSQVELQLRKLDKTLKIR